MLKFINFEFFQSFQIFSKTIFNTTIKYKNMNINMILMPLLEYNCSNINIYEYIYQLYSFLYTYISSPFEEIKRSSFLPRNCMCLLLR